MNKLNTEERRKKIEEMIRSKGEISVNEIRDMFDISNVTVRNDLIYLERKGVLRRGFGKAIFSHNNVADIFNFSNIHNLNEKEIIGKYAASLIKENESVLFYTGSTSLQVAKQINKVKNIIAVTNSILIAYELGKNPDIKTILVGGFYNASTGATFGEKAIHQLDDYNIDRVFLSVDGISAESGITNDNVYETEINRAMLKKSNEVIVVADHSKIGIQRFVKMGDIEDIHMLITDEKAPRDEVKKIENKGVKVIIV